MVLGGFEIVSSGGTASGTTVDAGGTQILSSGGLGFGAILSGGVQTLSNGAIASATMIANGGTQYVSSGGLASGTVINLGGDQIVSSGGSATFTTVSSGGTETVLSGGVVSDTLLMKFGAIDLAGLPYVSGATTATLDSATDILTVSAGTQSTTIQLSPAGSYVGLVFPVTPDSGTGTDVTLACYAEGTRIATPDGDVAIEALRPGDLVITMEAERRSVQPVRWIGHRRIDMTAHPDRATVAPIRFRAGAIDQDVPARDLLVSPAHGMFIDGAFIPAKKLVNHMTITRETAMASITWHHLELDRHAVVLAEGAPSETYLDTGNRGIFSNAEGATILHPDLATTLWNEAACAPMLESTAAVRAIWRRLADRARQAGHTPRPTSFVGDAVPCLRVGERDLSPIAWDGTTACFSLPPNAGPVRVISPVFRPMDVWPWLDDPRPLGLAVSQIALRSGRETTILPIDHPGLMSGWYPPETEGGTAWRWTNGDAELPIGRRPACLLELTLVPVPAARLNRAA